MTEMEEVSEVGRTSYTYMEVQILATYIRTHYAELHPKLDKPNTKRRLLDAWERAATELRSQGLPLSQGKKSAGAHLRDLWQKMVSRAKKYRDQRASTGGGPQPKFHDRHELVLEAIPIQVIQGFLGREAEAGNVISLLIQSQQQQQPTAAATATATTSAAATATTTAATTAATTAVTTTAATTAVTTSATTTAVTTTAVTTSATTSAATTSEQRQQQPRQQQPRQQQRGLKRQATCTDDGKLELLRIEKMKLDIQRQRLDIDKERLDVEKEKLQVLKEILANALKQNPTIQNEL